MEMALIKYPRFIMSYKTWKNKQPLIGECKDVRSGKYGFLLEVGMTVTIRYAGTNHNFFPGAKILEIQEDGLKINHQDNVFFVFFKETLANGKIDDEREMNIYPFCEQYFNEDQDIEEILNRVDDENMYSDKNIWDDRAYGKIRKEYLPKLTRLK